MEANIDISNIKVLQDFFNDLSHIDQAKIFMSAYRKAAKPLIAAIKANAPIRTGNLMRSIGSIEIPENISIIVGAKLRGTNKGWYGHLVEGGTTERFRRKKKDAPTGRIAATHFLENAYNATEGQIYDKIEKEWYNEIDRFIIKTNKKIKK